MIHDLDLPKTIQVQETWCAPACVQAIVAKHQNVARCQSWYAQLLSTSVLGTERWRIEATLVYYDLEVKEIRGLPSIPPGPSVTYLYDLRAYGNGHYACLVGWNSRRTFWMDPAIEIGYDTIPASKFLSRLTDGTGLMVTGGKRRTHPLTQEIEV